MNLDKKHLDKTLAKVITQEKQFANTLSKEQTICHRILRINLAVLT